MLVLGHDKKERLPKIRKVWVTARGRVEYSKSWMS